MSSQSYTLHPTPFSLPFRTIRWNKNSVRILDQRLLPGKVVYRDIRTYQEMAEAIQSLTVRGAPLIGSAAAWGVVLGFLRSQAKTPEALLKEFRKVAHTLQATRPTAVNLTWALRRMGKVIERGKRAPVDAIQASLLVEARRIQEEDRLTCEKLGRYGARLIKDGDTVLTHCNAGALGTCGIGTATAAIYTAKAQGKRFGVFVGETRPVLQGARLTMWELSRAGVEATLITDSMAGWMMKSEKVSLVMVGADRIARNGDAANKIGTYSLAILAREHKIPFYVSAPLSSFDASLATGEGISIEERSPDEVTSWAGLRVAPRGIKARNPAFDVTPAGYITALVTEKGILRKPDTSRLLRLLA
jgi:methylthioribose-1-phosphate isomerase